MARHDPRPVKITFGEMRSSGGVGIMIYCADPKCSHSIAMPADGWPDDVRLSDIEPRFRLAASEALRYGPTSLLPEMGTG